MCILFANKSAISSILESEELKYELANEIGNIGR